MRARTRKVRRSTDPLVALTFEVASVIRQFHRRVSENFARVENNEIWETLEMIFCSTSAHTVVSRGYRQISRAGWSNGHALGLRSHEHRFRPHVFCSQVECYAKASKRPKRSEWGDDRRVMTEYGTQSCNIGECWCTSKCSSHLHPLSFSGFALSVTIAPKSTKWQAHGRATTNPCQFRLPCGWM